ncbi:TPA: phage tail tape measure protein [Burkholderia vietnamiensis]|nr:phage tail tape measure protein [Burkholderia vietnamiensis]
MDITTLGVALDTSDLKQGESALNGAAEAAAKAADALDAVSDSAAKTGGTMIEVADVTQRASASTSQLASSYAGLTQANAEAAASGQKYLASLQQEFDLLGLNRAETEAYIAKAQGFSASQQEVAAALGAKIDAWKRDEAASRASAAAQDRAAAAADVFIAKLQAQVDAIGKTKAELLEMQAAQLGVTDQAAPLIAALEAQTAATAQLGETEAQATTRISAMVAASLEAQAAMTDSAAVAARYAASVDEMAASATIAERANAGIAVSAREVAAAQAMAAEQVQVASTVVSSSAEKVAEALGRQLTALTATKAQMVEYDAQMAGFTAAETAQLTAIAKEIDLRKQQIALGTEMAAVYAADAAGAKAANVATSGVTSELMVMGREVASGNYTRLAGSFTRFLSLAGALNLLLNPLSLAIVGVGASMLYVAEQNSKLNEALVMTGNYAGITSDQLRGMAQAATANGATFKTAAESMTELAATGRLTGDEIAKLGQTTADVATYTGTSVKQMVDEFTKLADEPVRASVKLNDQYHYLTASTYDQIVALEKQGDATGAAQVAVEAFSHAMDERTKEIAANEGVILKGWRDIKGAINEAIEAIGSFGATATPGQVVSRMQANKASRLPIGQWDSTDESELQQAISTYQASVKAAEEKARAARHQQQIIDAKSAYETWNNQFATPAEKRAREVQSYLDKIATPLNLSPDQQLDDLQKINDKYKDKKGATPRRNDNGVNADLADLQNQQRMIEDALRTSLEHVKALRQQGVIDEKDAIAQSYALEQTALQRRIDIDEQQLEIAKGKKNTEAYRRYADDIARLQSQMLNNYQKFGDAIATYDAKQAMAIKTYSDSLAEQLATQQSAANTKLAGLSMGSNDRADFETQIRLMEDYDKKRASLAKSLTEGRIDKSQYDGELAALQDYYSKSVAIAQTSSDEIKAANADWTTGAKRAIADYGDQAANVANDTAKTFSDAFRGMEDAFATFVTTGKLSFGSLATSVIADIARMQARAAISGLFKYGEDTLPGLFSSAVAAVTGTRANGGTVDSDGTYLVGENGPELFRPGSSGTIIPNNALQSSGSSGASSTITVSVPVTVEGNASQSNQQNAGDLSMKIKQAVQAVLQNERRQGGVLWKLQNGVN